LPPAFSSPARDNFRRIFEQRLLAVAELLQLVSVALRRQVDSFPFGCIRLVRLPRGLSP